MSGYDDRVRPRAGRGTVLAAAGVLLVAVILAVVWFTRPEPRVECPRPEQKIASEPQWPSGTPVATCLEDGRPKGGEPAGPPR